MTALGKVVNSMRCPFCNQEIEDDSRFCFYCGKGIPRCPECGRVVTEKSLFCIFDGTPLPPEVVNAFSEAEAVPPEPAPVLPGTNGTAAPSRRERRPRKKSKAPVVIAIAAVLAVIVLTVLTVIFIWGGENDGGGKTLSKRETEETTEPTETEKTRETTEPTEASEPTEPSGAGTTPPTTAATTAPPTTVAAQPLSTAPPETEPAQTQPPAPTPEERMLYIILHADSELFAPEDLDGLGEELCNLARNGIYARHGRMFNDATLQAYFEQFDWYEPTVAPEAFSDSVFNYTELANIAMIRDYERSHF